MTRTRSLAAASLVSALALFASRDARAISDATAPTLASLSPSPLSVDVTTGPATLSIGYQVADDLSGVKSVEVSVGPASASGTCEGSVAVARTESFTPATSRSGTIDLTIPLHAPSGAWTLCNLTLEDAVGNVATLGAADFDLLGAVHDFAVVSDPDVTPPTLAAFGPLPASVDTTGGNASFDVPATVTDDISGVVRITPIVGPAVGGECTGAQTVVLQNVVSPAQLSSSGPIHLEIPAFRAAD
ncbi:MAG: hypothetical protein ACKPBU_17325, partial [Alphaproteobacteria bacterium]